MTDQPTFPGANHFRQSIAQAADAGEAALLRRLAEWVDDLEAEGLCRVESGERQNATTLYPRLKKGGATIAYVWNYKGSARLYVNGTVIPEPARTNIETAAGRALPNVNMRAPDITEGLLDALTQAYHKAAGV